jgi:hypothetical protein
MKPLRDHIWKRVDHVLKRVNENLDHRDKFNFVKQLMWSVDRQTSSHIRFMVCDKLYIYFIADWLK